MCYEVYEKESGELVVLAEDYESAEWEVKHLEDEDKQLGRYKPNRYDFRRYVKGEKR